MARECYLVSIRPLVGRAREHGSDGLPQVEKRAKIRPATTVPEALVIHIFASAEPLWPRPEATGEVEQVPLEEE